MPFSSNFSMSLLLSFDPCAAQAIKTSNAFLASTRSLYHITRALRCSAQSESFMASTRCSTLVLTSKLLCHKRHLHNLLLREATLMIFSPLPVPLSFAPTYKIPLESISKVTSTCGVKKKVGRGREIDDAPSETAHHAQHSHTQPCT